MTVCVFLGPTLRGAEASAALDAVLLPPARRGDVVAAVRDRGATTIALVDGYFEQAPAVWHKEILWALSEGVAVFGAASMGALRAAELAQFGMTGVGRVFEAYRDGRFAPFEDPFEDDDEVAVVHGPVETGYAGTLALVDARATLARAQAEGVVDAATVRAVAAAGKALFYKDRSWPAIFAAARAKGGADKARLDRLVAALPRIAVAQKRADALALLALLAAGDRADATPPPFRFERTAIWDAAFPEPGAEAAHWLSR